MSLFVTDGSVLAETIRSSCPSTSVTEQFESVPTGWTGTKATATFLALEIATFTTANDGVRCWYNSLDAGDDYIYKKYSGYVCKATSGSAVAFSCTK